MVAVSIAGTVVDLATTSDLPFLPLLRMLRVARMFRLIPRARGLNVLMQTLVFSIPALANVGSVLFLFLFVFAVVGMNLFGSVKPGKYLDANANFGDVGTALLTLFRMITGESWDGERPAGQPAGEGSAARVWACEPHATHGRDQRTGSRAAVGWPPKRRRSREWEGGPHAVLDRCTSSGPHSALLANHTTAFAPPRYHG